MNLVDIIEGTGHDQQLVIAPAPMYHRPRVVVAPIPYPGIIIKADRAQVLGDVSLFPVKLHDV